jgi:hypothetical protein
MLVVMVEQAPEQVVVVLVEWVVLGQAPIVVDLVDLVFKFHQHSKIQQLLQVIQQVHYHIKEVVV